MTTIPSIFNEHKVSYTVLGGAEKSGRVTMPSVTCVVLSRNARQYRTMILENLLAKGFAKVVSVNPKTEKGSIEQLAHHFPTIDFLVALENVSQGELLNLAFAHATTEYVLVLQEEMCCEKISLNPAIIDRMIEKKQFCIVPRLHNVDGGRIPVSFIPATNRSVFVIESDSSLSDNQKTLYSYDYAGFYDRERFCLLGGIDYTISSPYWQKIDFFFRSWLWGETTTVLNSFDLSYSGSVPEEDHTVELSYVRFYLKNLLPVFVSDHGRISKSSFIRFRMRSGCGLVESMRQFNDAIRWTKENQYRFKTDAVSLIEDWGKQ